MQLKSRSCDQWRCKCEDSRACNHVAVIQQIFRRNVNIRVGVEPPRYESVELEVRIQGQRITIVVEYRTVAASLKCDSHESRIAVARLESEFVARYLWNLQPNQRLIGGGGGYKRLDARP